MPPVGRVVPPPPQRPPPPVDKWARGPGVRMADPFFANAWRAAGFQGKPPPVSVAPMYMLGQQPYNNRNVFINPTVSRGLRTLPLGGQAKDLQALNVLLHEYAHVNQPRVFPRNRTEAGADLWSVANTARVARKLGIDPDPGRFGIPPQYGYPNWSFGLMRTRGPERFIEHGQFGR